MREIANFGSVNYFTEGDDSGVVFQTSVILHHMLFYWRVHLKPRGKGLGVETRLGTDCIASSGPDKARELHY